MVVVDVETTSLNPWTTSLLSIAAVSFEHPENTFYAECRVDPSATDITDEALAVNGFTREQIFDPAKPSAAECVAQFLAWMKRSGYTRDDEILSGQDCAFDKYCIFTVCQRAGLKFPFQHRTVDLHAVYYALHVREHGSQPEPRTSFNLDYILAHVGLPRRTGSHNALDDVKLEAEALSRLLYKKNLLPEFKSFSLPVIF